jgi:putative transcriptional regulator
MVDGDRLIAPRVLNIPLLVDDATFDPRELLGLDPWPPRRPLNALQRARIATGLLQHELATELSISRQTLSSIENRHRVPSVRLALAFAVALSSTVEELFPLDELIR